MDERGLTLEQLADKIGRHHSTLVKAFQRGTARQSTVVAIRKALRLKKSDMLPPEEKKIA